MNSTFPTAIDLSSLGVWLYSFCGVDRCSIQVNVKKLLILCDYIWTINVVYVNVVSSA